MNREEPPSTKWNEAEPDHRHRCVHHRFEAQAARIPDALALVCGDDKLSFSELNRCANQLAHFLKSRGIGPNRPVSLCIERSTSMIVGMLAVLKAGGCYVPLEADLPAARLHTFLDQTQATILLTQSPLKNRFGDWTGEVICLDTDYAGWKSLPITNPEHANTLDDLVYVIFTSGSTGVPKGVGNLQRGLANYTAAIASIIGLDDNSSPTPWHFGTVSPLSADLGNTAVFPSLAYGGCLHVITYETATDAARFEAYIHAHPLDMLKITPSHLRALLSASEGEILPRRYLFLGGEALTWDLLDRIRQRGPCRVINHYGPTETTIGSLTYDTSEGGVGPTESATVPIGRPIANTYLHILTEAGQPVAIGGTGELFIGGAGVASGYLGRPDLTAERFVPDPFGSNPEARLYRTGDLVRPLPSGDIEFLGRIDQQVKIRGFRIELGEIEAVLMQHPHVQAAAVVAREETSGDKRLVAYVVNREAMPNENVLREHLRAKLPDYMTPTAFVFLEAMPRSANGKLDHKALPAPNTDPLPEPKTFVAPRSLDEEKLAGIWQESLGISYVSVDASFFELGGHSLLAIRLLSEIRREFKVSLSLAEMFRASTVGQMARLIQRKQSGEDTWSPLVSLQPRGARLPLFCAPAGGGSAFYYRRLAEHIGPDQPLYVFEPIGMNGVDAPHETVEEMATYYILHMRTVQPNGPYRLCGLSFGGVIAYEMAQQLRADGEKIGCLILFDSYAPGYMPAGQTSVRKPLLSLQNSLFKVRSYGEDLWVGMTQGSRTRYLALRLRKIRQRFQKGTPRTVPYGNPAGMELPETFQKVQCAEDRARTSYQPKEYPAPVILLRAHLQTPGGERDSRLGWGEWTQNIVAIQTQGTHFSLLEEPCVQVTLKHVKKALSET